MAPEVGFKPTTYRLEGGYCCSLSYSGMWWDPWDSNPDNTGYEPGARTNCTKVPYLATDGGVDPHAPHGTLSVFKTGLRAAAIHPPNYWCS